MGTDYLNREGVIDMLIELQTDSEKTYKFLKAINAISIIRCKDCALRGLSPCPAKDQKDDFFCSKAIEKLNQILPVFKDCKTLEDSRIAFLLYCYDNNVPSLKIRSVLNVLNAIDLDKETWEMHASNLLLANEVEAYGPHYSREQRDRLDAIIDERGLNYREIYSVMRGKNEVQQELAAKELIEDINKYFKEFE